MALFTRKQANKQTAHHFPTAADILSTNFTFVNAQSTFVKHKVASITDNSVAF